MKQVTIYTDGACSGNPGPGGWGAILQYGEHRKELSGGERNTTNNRMELTGVIRALQALTEPCVVELYSDSKYVIDALEKGYGKQTPVEEYRITARGGLGIKNYGLTDKTGRVVGIKVVDGSEDLLVLTEKGILLRTAVDTIKTCGRSTQGVIVMRFKEEDDQVISIALAEREPEEDQPLEESGTDE